jgi:hypothetical protein
MFSFFGACVEIPPLIFIGVYILRETGLTLEHAIMFFDWLISRIGDMMTCLSGPSYQNGSFDEV